MIRTPDSIQGLTDPLSINVEPGFALESAQMAATGAQAQDMPVAIAPAPPRVGSSGLESNENVSQPPMAYTCQTCAKRKVKCDKSAPTCSTCRRSKLECIYQAPPPRRRKRKINDDVYERLARYERILGQHGLLPEDAKISATIEEVPPKPLPFRWKTQESPRSGKLLTDQGKSLYMESNLWHGLSDNGVQHMSDEEDEDQLVAGVPECLPSDPLTGAFMDSQQSIAQYHPTHAQAMMLWRIHIENVEPICKILHIPSTTEMVEAASQQLEMTSKADECLLFSVYHFAVYSMSEDECMKKLGQSRASLIQRFHFATRQALVNASFLKTTEMSILQALVLFLLPCRYYYDPHTYWILTGVAVRIAQRMGLHRDGETLGLPPFEVQMRRRLFYQLLPLDGNASQVSGASIGTLPDTWDTQEPLNIDDDQIWPGMTEPPEEKKGATDMIFRLARSCVGKCSIRVGKLTRAKDSPQHNDYEKAELIVNETESEVEEKFIRYCDVVNPIHFLTAASARAGIIAMRLQIRLPKVKNKTANDAEKRELFELSQKIIDVDTATCSHTGLGRFQWHMRSFFLWGTWDSLIFILTTLWTSNIVSSTATDAAWSRVEQIYNNHKEVLELKVPLYVAFKRLTLKAWDASPPSSSTPEPPLIETLRSQQKAKRKRGEGINVGDGSILNSKKNITSLIDLPSTSDGRELFGSLNSGAAFDTGSDFSLEAADWAFWEQLIHEHRLA